MAANPASFFASHLLLNARARVCVCFGCLPLSFPSQLTADGMIGGPEWGPGDLVTFGTHTAHLTDVALFVQLLFGFVLQLADILHG